MFKNAEVIWEIRDKGMEPGSSKRFKIDSLFSDVVVCPGAEEWLVRLVSRIIQLYRIDASVSRSQLDAMSKKPEGSPCI